MKDEQQVRLEALKFAASQRIAGSMLISEAKRFEAYILTGQDEQSSPVTAGKAPAAEPASKVSKAPSDDGQASDEPKENKPKRRRSNRAATPVQS